MRAQTKNKQKKRKHSKPLCWEFFSFFHICLSIEMLSIIYGTNFCSWTERKMKMKSNWNDDWCWWKQNKTINKREQSWSINNIDQIMAFNYLLFCCCWFVSLHVFNLMIIRTNKYGQNWLINLGSFSVMETRKKN